ncbi:unnamed protein product, partial [Mesorhabditis spiculigera]
MQTTVALVVALGALIAAASAAVMPLRRPFGQHVEKRSGQGLDDVACSASRTPPNANSVKVGISKLARQMLGQQFPPQHRQHQSGDQAVLYL